MAEEHPGAQTDAAEGRLGVRPRAPGLPAPGEGLVQLGLGRRRDGLLYVPTAYRPEAPAPFALCLHGAGGNAQHALLPLMPLAEEAGVVLLAPDSQAPTWDLLAGGWGPDVRFILRALEHAFARLALDPARLAVEGFSDGASYALSLGLTNGDLFTHVLAFSPGFAAPAEPRGRPRVFVAHGTRDAVLPIQRCSRALVPRLERAGYAPRYVEFDGPHTVPPEVAREALDFFLG